MARKVGSLGENTFSTLCSSVNIIPTKPSEDENGWDSFLEFPWIKNENISLDLQETPIRCKVQIKSTDNQKQRSLAIKLSAIHKLAVEHMPSFICFMHFNKKSTPQEIYIVHINESVLEIILKAVRKAEFENKKTNKVNISIKYNEDNKLIEPTGEMIKKEILKFIPDGMEKYIKNKQDILKTLGYTEQPSSLSFSLVALKKEELIEKFLIKQDKVNINITSFDEERFGIKLPVIKDSNLQGAVLEVKNKENRITLYARKHKYDKPVIVNLLCHSHPFVPNVVMLNSTFFTILIDYSKKSLNEFKISLDYNEEFEFGILLSHLKFIKLSEDNINKEVDWELNILEHDLEPLKMKSIQNKKSNIPKDVFEAILLYEKLFKHLEINFNTKFSITYLMQHFNSAKNYFLTLTLENSCNFSMESNIDKDNNSYSPQVINNYSIFLPAFFHFKNTIYSIIIELISTLNLKENNSLVAVGTKGKIIKSYEINEDDFDEKEFYNDIDTVAKGLNYTEYGVCINEKIKYNLDDSRIKCKK